MFEFESDRSGSVVEVGEPVTALAGVETGDQSAVRGEVPRHVGDDVSFGSGAEEDHDVAGERDKVEGAGEVDVEQVGETPLEFGGLRSGGVEQSRIGSTPTTSWPRRASSIATRPVPQPASSTDPPALNALIRSASPWIPSPESARSRHRWS